MNPLLFIEAICLANGQLSNLRFHNNRLNSTRQIHFERIETWELETLITVPEDLKKGVYKCRVTYGEKVEKIEFEPYQPRRVQSLRLVQDDHIVYDFKYQNRAQLNALYAQRDQADEVLIVKNGFIADTSYSNIVFWNGTTWHTPQTPLLAGTQRARLLEEGIIFEKKIRAQDLPKYAHARIINAMLDFETTPNISIEAIR